MGASSQILEDKAHGSVDQCSLGQQMLTHHKSRQKTSANVLERELELYHLGDIESRAKYFGGMSWSVSKAGLLSGREMTTWKANRLQSSADVQFYKHIILVEVVQRPVVQTRCKALMVVHRQG